MIDRLSHKGAYKHVGNNHAELVDIVIVVDMLLTGFDSQWINVLYLDDVIETNNLIQAISRTNRIFNNDEKPLGLVKFYRKPYSMERNLQEALSLYCQGDYEGVEVKDIQTNLALMNKTYSEIEKIFVANKIKNFECLPSSMEDRGMFRKKFTVLKRTLRAVMLQGFRWDNAYAKMLIFDKKTYEKLYMRYKDTLTTGGGGGGVSKPGYVVNNNLSTMEMDKIDVDYLEKWFKIVTMKDIVEQEKREKQMDALYELESNLGLLSELQQQYARKIIDDIRKGKFEPEAGKTFREYISEYQEKTIRANIHTISENTGLNEEDLFKLYVDTGNGYVDELRMKNLENTVDDNKLLEYYPNTSLLKAKIMLHAELKDYIENRKADSIN